MNICDLCQTQGANDCLEPDIDLRECADFKGDVYKVRQLLNERALIRTQVEKLRDEEVKAFKKEWEYNLLDPRDSYGAHCAVQECDNHGDIETAGIMIGSVQTLQEVLKLLGGES